jgi:hypothetical protein
MILSKSCGFHRAPNQPVPGRDASGLSHFLKEQRKNSDRFAVISVLDRGEVQDFCGEREIARCKFLENSKTARRVMHPVMPSAGFVQSDERMLAKAKAIWMVLPN